MRRIVIGLLRQLGYTRILEAEDGAQAFRVVERGGVGAIITDWNMPGVTGLDLLKMVRAHETAANTPVLMITAEARKDNIVEAAQAGADGYIVKPFAADTLQQKLHLMFKKRGITP